MTVTADLLSFLKSHAALAADPSGGDHVLSVYLDNSESNPSRRHAWREQLRQFVRAEHARMAASPGMIDHFERCLTVLEARLPDLHAEVKPENATVPGWMLLCAPTGEVIEARLSAPPTPMLRWAPCAILLPYLVATQAEDAVVVLIDLDHATIARLQRGIVREIDAVTADITVEVGSHMGDAPRAGMHSGTRGETRTDSAQRQLREAHDRLLTAVRRKLAVIAGNDARVVIGGASGSVAHFVATLPGELAARCAVADGLYMHTPFAQIPPIAHAALVDLVARRQVEALTTLNRRAHLTRHAAFGFDAVMHASAAGAIERVMVTETLWAERTMALEQLCQRALRSGGCADVATGAAIPALDERGGIAAELRFAVSA